MVQTFQDFATAMRSQNGYLLASCISPTPPTDDPARLYTFYRFTNRMSVEADVRYAIQYDGDTKHELGRQEQMVWSSVFVEYWRAVGEILAAEETANAGRGREEEGRKKKGEEGWDRVYDAWKEVVKVLNKGYQAGLLPAWTIPCLYIAAKYLRIFAIKADDGAKRTKGRGGLSFNAAAGLQDDVVGSVDGQERLEEAARMINTMFSLCINDRAPIEESRKWGVYYMTNLLFKTFFKLNQLNLCKSSLRALQASNTDMPPLEAFPKSHQVAFKYYVGVVHFLEEDYNTAETYLTSALSLCRTSSTSNIILILTYLIPTRLLTSHVLPTATLLAPYPQLQQNFQPLCSAIKRGSLADFDRALSAGEDAFVKRRIYLTLERGRDICLRNLFRRVFLAGGHEEPKEGQTEPDGVRRTRVPVKEFAAAVRVSEEKGVEEVTDLDEVEGLVAGQIYKNLMKGYIARDRGIVVLSKGGAFPGTGV
ncbi:hypothetical protein LTR28_004992 [Elasticomyces elasticus]|nr:hypothetical protein LTR28_004992 [Elasticomyces elasticus]